MDAKANRIQANKDGTTMASISCTIFEAEAKERLGLSVQPLLALLALCNSLPLGKSSRSMICNIYS